MGHPLDRASPELSIALDFVTLGPVGFVGGLVLVFLQALKLAADIQARIAEAENLQADTALKETMITAYRQDYEARHAAMYDDLRRDFDLSDLAGEDLTRHAKAIERFNKHLEHGVRVNLPSSAPPEIREIFDGAKYVPAEPALAIEEKRPTVEKQQTEKTEEAEETDPSD